MLEFDDAVSSGGECVDPECMGNLRDEARDIKLFFHQAFRISDERSAADTACCAAERTGTAALSRQVLLAIGAVNYNGKSFDQFSVGRFGAPGLDGTWRDAEDGELAGCRRDDGATDSILRLSLTIPVRIAACAVLAGGGAIFRERR